MRIPPWLCALAVLLLVVAGCTGAGTTRTPPADVHISQLPLGQVVFSTADGGTATLLVEVADEEEERACGLMHRTTLPADQGMLFVFEDDDDGPFWNRNTFIPLTLAWIGADGIIFALSDMEPVRPEDHPQINTLYHPRRMYRYVIEANQGWFARNGVAVGDRPDLSDALSRRVAPPPICRERGL